jgi:hydroxymethylpyrimidine/phosphomethylpyrimidine kinase
MGFSLCKHCVIYTPNTQQTSLLHGLHIKIRVRLSSSQDSVRERSCAAIGLKGGKFTRGFLRQHCRIGSAVGTTAAMTLLIVMHGTEMNVKSVFALLSQKVTKAMIATYYRFISLTNEVIF